MRMHGHAAHDDMRYVPAELLEQWRERDPIERQQRRVRELRRRRRGAPRARSRPSSSGRSSEALEQPMPDPPTARDGRLLRGRGRAARRRAARPAAASRSGGVAMPEMTYLQAISDGLREEMRADERVF